MKSITGSILICLIGVAQANASTHLLRHEPPKGRLPAGQKVLVDDGSCPKGQIKEVKGGSDRSLRTGASLPGAGRTYRCIMRP